MGHQGDTSRIHGILTLYIECALPLLFVRYTDESHPLDQVIFTQWLDQFLTDDDLGESKQDFPNLIFKVGKLVIMCITFLEPFTDREPYMERLGRLVYQFEDMYNDLLVNFNGNINPFRDFEPRILAEFPPHD